MKSSIAYGFLTCFVLLLGCSSDSDSLWFEYNNMLKLRLQSEAFDYSVEGNEVNEVGFFYSKRKIVGFNKMLISGVKSTWSHAPIQFKVNISYRGDEEFITKEMLKVGEYSSGGTDGILQIHYDLIDEKGVQWSTSPGPTSKSQPKSKITVENVEVRYSPLNGSKKNKVTMSFESRFYNDVNEWIDVSGRFTAVVDPRF